MVSPIAIVIPIVLVVVVVVIILLVWCCYVKPKSRPTPRVPTPGEMRNANLTFQVVHHPPAKRTPGAVTSVKKPRAVGKGGGVSGSTEPPSDGGGGDTGKKRVTIVEGTPPRSRPHRLEPLSNPPPIVNRSEVDSDWDSGDSDASGHGTGQIM